MVYFFDGGFLGVLVVLPVEVEGVEASTAALAAAATENIPFCLINKWIT